LEVEYSFRRFIDDRGEFVANQIGDGLTHRQTQGFAVATPRRPHRIRHRHLHRLHTSRVVQLDKDPTVDPRQDATIQRHYSSSPANQ
jgi:hypothetical protein